MAYVYAENVINLIKYIKKYGSGGGTTVEPNPQQPAEYFLDSVKIGDDAFIVKQVPRDGQENQMLVRRGAAETGLQFVNTDSIIVDVSAVAPKYDATKNQTGVYTNAYAKGDMVTYQNKLYKANTNLKSRAGEFLSTGWDKMLDWDEYSTYTEGMKRVYEGAVYECVVATATVGEFKSDEWNDVSTSFEDYSETAVYTAGVSKVKYEDDFYTANYNYMGTGGVGPFTAIYWDETTVEAQLKEAKNAVQTETKALNNVTTDENGFIAIADIPNFTPTGKTILNTIAYPYGGFAPAGTLGYCYTKVNANYILVESLTNGVRAPITSATLDSTHFITIVYKNI